MTIVVANTLFIAANGAMAYGIEVFVDKTRRIRLFLSFVVAIFVLFIYFTYYVPNVTARIVIVSLMLSILYGYCAYIVHKYIPRVMNGKNMLLITAFSIQAVWFAFRVPPTLFLEGPIVDFMKSSAFHGGAFVAFFSGNIFIVIGLIALNSQRVELDLLSALEEVKILRGIIPICASCKKIRSDEGVWDQLEVYIQEHSEAEFSHSICPECMVKLYPEYVDTDGKTAVIESS
ncbi:MAG: hypothetical protein D3909_15005 [Candidatus Electrothrix sp. ATG1]|nr:hypothetical protein [Candidatus Electrothrix sp. ATG1]